MIIALNCELEQLLNAYIVVHEMPKEEVFLQEHWLNTPLRIEESKNTDGEFVLVNENVDWKCNDRLNPALPMEIEIVTYK